MLILLRSIRTSQAGRYQLAPRAAGKEEMMGELIMVSFPRGASAVIRAGGAG